MRRGVSLYQLGDEQAIELARTALTECGCRDLELVYRHFRSAHAEPFACFRFSYDTEDELAGIFERKQAVPYLNLESDHTTWERKRRQKQVQREFALDLL